MIIAIILKLVLVYLALGLVFAIPFVIRGAGKIDEGAADGSRGFRIIIIPGTIVFWPLLLNKWRRAVKKEKAGINKKEVLT